MEMVFGIILAIFIAAIYLISRFVNRRNKAKEQEFDNWSNSKLSSTPLAKIEMQLPFPTFLFKLRPSVNTKVWIDEGDFKGSFPSFKM